MSSDKKGDLVIWSDLRHLCRGIRASTGGPWSITYNVIVADLCRGSCGAWGLCEHMFNRQSSPTYVLFIFYPLQPEKGAA